jgi:hypothetical protein
MNSFTTRPILYTGVLFIALAACTGIVEAPDESAGASTGVAMCSSKTYWMEADKGSELMHPGGACNACHDKTPTAPNYTIAGTVYPTAHEPDGCNGVVGKADVNGMAEVTVVITDNSGRSLPPLPVNSAGNFKYEVAVSAPYKVKVVTKGGKENKMVMSPPHGDCNACHTQNGANAAPGRIVVPQ